MFMFLPFLMALITAGTAVRGKYCASIAFFFLTLVITLASFKHHATGPLGLVF